MFTYVCLNMTVFIHTGAMTSPSSVQYNYIVSFSGSINDVALLDSTHGAGSRVRALTGQRAGNRNLPLLLSCLHVGTGLKRLSQRFRKIRLPVGSISFL